MKTSIINPIPKTTNPSAPEDFRPINMLPITEKIIEVAVKNQLAEYIEQNDILIRQQSGFRKQHSCETAINLMLSNWMDNIEKNQEIVAVFLDFKRAFETIDRKLLIKKLEIYGCDENALEWFANYLTDRNQKVKIDDKISESITVQNGLPQGSVLSPLLFVLYINDINLIMDHSSLNLFADDTTMTVADNNPENAFKKMNHDLAKLDDWLRYNKMALNIKKTNFMHITNKMKSTGSENLKINDMNIIQANCVKYLGIKIDDKLSFKPHLYFIKAKMHKKLGLLRRINEKLTKESKIIFYKSIVAPHLDYCATILFLSSEHQLEQLQKVQNKFMRILLQANKETHVDDMLQELNILSVNQQIKANSIKFLHKVNIGSAPKYLTEKLIKRKTFLSYPIRSGDDINLPNFKKNLTQNSLMYKGLKLYNDFKSKHPIINYSNLLDECNLYVKNH